MLATVSFYGVLAAIFFYVLRYDSGFRDSSSVVIAFAGISLCLLVNGQLLTLLLVAFVGFALAKKVQAIEVELMDALSSLTGAEKARKTAASQLESLRNELTLTGLNAELETRLQAKAEQARAEAERARAEAERAGRRERPSFGPSEHSRGRGLMLMVSLTANVRVTGDTPLRNLGALTATKTRVSACLPPRLKRGYGKEISHQSLELGSVFDFCWRTTTLRPPTPLWPQSLVEPLLQKDSSEENREEMSLDSFIPPTPLARHSSSRREPLGRVVSTRVIQSL